jgi:methylmalonyl-CoA mutase
MTAAPDQAPEPLALAEGFPELDRHRWHDLVAKVLRKSGALDADAPADAAERALVTRTYDGVDLLPLYTADDAGDLPARAGLPGAAPYVRGRRAEGSAPAGWDVRQHHADPDPAASRRAVLADLENGVTSLWLTLGPAGIAVEALPEVLADVHLDLAPVILDAGAQTAAAADAFFALAAAKGVAPHALAGNLGADPLGQRARTGEAASLDGAAELALRCARDYPGLRAITVDATPFHGGGGSDAEELGCSLAAGVAYLRALTAAGLGTEAALAQLEFRYAATADQFLTIAKLRAARRTWARVAQVCGVTGSAGGQRQHAVTSSVMTTRRDPWVNLLRTTLACFGAGVGGADAVTVQPFDAAIGLPDDFSRRIARNTSSLLLLESNVARVIDPAGGSWYVERLTEDLAAAAWEWFTEIERTGGLAAALESGLVAGRLAATWDRRAKNLAVRRDALTGVSEFPNLTEAPVTRRPYPAPPPTGGLPPHRYAEEYEALRDRADDVAAERGDRPAVFLATLGPVAVHTARAAFAANLFQAGGLATPASGTTTDPGEIAAAFRAAGATLACLASSDGLYAEHAAPVAAALKAAGARRVWLAGRPGDRREADAAAGVDGYVHAGCDALAVLRDAHQEAGVAR